MQQFQFCLLDINKNELVVLDKATLTGKKAFQLSVRHKETRDIKIY